jgi:hypothetical protein
LEGYNSRLSQVLPKVPLKVDKMVDFLAKEDKYWVDTLSKTRLWDERKRKTENDRAAYQRAQEKKVRLTAADYIVGSGKGAGQRGSQSTTITTTTASNQAVDLNECKDQDAIIDLIDPQPPPPPPLLSPNSVIHAVLTRTSFTEQGLFAKVTFIITNTIY